LLAQAEDHSSPQPEYGSSLFVVVEVLEKFSLLDFRLGQFNEHSVEKWWMLDLRYGAIDCQISHPDSLPTLILGLLWISLINNQTIELRSEGNLHGSQYTPLEQGSTDLSFTLEVVCLHLFVSVAADFLGFRCTCVPLELKHFGSQDC
jgi:hypothetical protein